MIGEPERFGGHDMRFDERYLKEAGRTLDRMTLLLSDLIAIPSLSGSEGAVIQRVGQEMTDLGYDKVVVDDFGSILGRLGHGPLRILFNSHVDTVGVGNPSAWNYDPFAARLVDGVVHGRGASDSKAAIAAMVHGASLSQRLNRDTSSYTAYVAGTVHQETFDGLALEHLLANELLTPHVVVLGQPTDLNINRGHRGRVVFAVRTRARAIGRVEFVQRNPIYQARSIIDQVRALNERLPNDSFLGKGSVEVTMIESEGSSDLSMPESCTIYLERRLTTGETLRSAMSELESLPTVCEAGAAVWVMRDEVRSYTGLKLTAEKYFPTWTIDERHLAVDAGVRTCKLAVGRAPLIGSWGECTAGGSSAGKLRIPTIGFGPGNGIHAHSTKDQCHLEHLQLAAAWYAAFPSVFGATQTEAVGQLDS